MKGLIICMVSFFILLGCSKEESTEIESKNSTGLLNFNGGILADTFSSSAKYETPECSEKLPISIRYVLTDSNDSVITAQSTIKLEGNRVLATKAISLNEGDYTVDDIALLSSDETVVQRMPSKLTSGFDFTNFVDISTPFDITVQPNEEITLTGDLLCYSIPEGDFDENVSGEFDIKELQTLYIRITESNALCANKLIIEVENRITDEIVIAEAGLYNTPIPMGSVKIEVKLFSNDELIHSCVIPDEYNQDGLLDSDDIIEFTTTCDETESEPVAIFDYRNGGIVFWIDPNDNSRGLVCAISDQGQAPWGCDGVEVMAPDQNPESLNHNGTRLNIGSGKRNTFNIIYTCPDEPNIAARLSDNYSVTVDGVLYDDWFLPSAFELDLLYSNKAAINATALSNGGNTFEEKEYWSSSHASTDFLFFSLFQNFENGEENGSSKTSSFKVRSICAF